jgi:hypothetical protein
VASLDSERHLVQQAVVDLIKTHVS